MPLIACVQTLRRASGAAALKACAKNECKRKKVHSHATRSMCADIEEGKSVAAALKACAKGGGTRRKRVSITGDAV